MEYKNLKTRVFTGLVLAALVVLAGAVAAYSCYGKLVLLACFLLGCLLCAVEYGVLCSRSTNKVARLIYILVVSFPPLMTAGAVSKVAFGYLPSPSAALCLAMASFVIALIFSIVAIVVISKEGGLVNAQKVALELFSGSLLVGLGGASLMGVLFLNGSVLYLFWLILVVCLNDIAAYFVGQRVGGPKLAELISPSKTISGSIGGFAGGIAAGVIFGMIFGLFCWPSAILLSLGVVAAAQCGDLLKSLIKRLNDAKDSGSLLPGHGGFLDRMDGILLGSLALISFLAVL